VKGVWIGVLCPAVIFTIAVAQSEVKSPAGKVQTAVVIYPIARSTRDGAFPTERRSEPSLVQTLVYLKRRLLKYKKKLKRSKRAKYWKNAKLFLNTD
jgi:hypothetical protein